jgi:hypothetical protein
MPINPITGAGWLKAINENFQMLGPTPVKIYYVDNVNGESDGDGTEGSPFDQIAAAVTAWETLRLTLDNVYSRAIIYVIGTGVAYTALTKLPNYCDIIGVGANPNGNGTGIAIIGANGADGITDTGNTVAGQTRGLGLYNLQFVSGGAFWCADFATLLRSTIEGCAFQTKDAASDGGIRFSGSCGGVTIRNCHWLGSGNVIAKVGIEIDGPNFNDCVIEGNHIHGTTAGILVADTCSTGQNGTAADNTIVKDNVIGDLGRGCAKGVDDNEVDGMITYAGNYITATDAMELTNRGTVRAIGNHVINTTTGAVEVSGS